MKVTIDGQTISVIQSDRNLIDVADRAKIAIPCACYRSGRAKGCCRSCVVEIDGKAMYACNTAPADGMRVVVMRSDLTAIRKQRLSEWRKKLRVGSKECCRSNASDCCE